MRGFEKLLILPSNGLEYEKFCYLKPITIEYFLYNNDIEIDSINFSEKMVTILRKYVVIDTPLTELYTADFYFLWLNFILQIIEDKYYLNSICVNEECKKENKIAINIGDFETIYYEGSEIYKEKTINDTIIKYRRRKVKDNLIFGILNMNVGTKFNIEQIISYILSQIVEINWQNNKLLPNEYAEFLKFNFKHDEIIDVFFTTFAEQDFGIYNKFKYKCKSCGEENHTELFNNLGHSMIIEERNVNFSDKKIIYEMLLNIARTPVITISELLDMPYKDFDIFIDKLKDIKFQTLF